jgi:hypothetical protein
MPLHAHAQWTAKYGKGCACGSMPGTLPEIKSSMLDTLTRQERRRSAEPSPPQVPACQWSENQASIDVVLWLHVM